MRAHDNASCVCRDRIAVSSTYFWTAAAVARAPCSDNRRAIICTSTCKADCKNDSATCISSVHLHAPLRIVLEVWKQHYVVTRKRSVVGGERCLALAVRRHLNTPRTLFRTWQIFFLQRVMQRSDAAAACCSRRRSALPATWATNNKHRRSRRRSTR
jgi:hypothetical protein